MIKPAYNHFHDKLHSHRSDGNVAGTPTPPSTPVLERSARPLPELPNQVNDFAGSNSPTLFQDYDSTPEAAPPKPQTAAEVLHAISYGNDFNNDDGFSLDLFREGVNDLPTDEIKTLLTKHSDELLNDRIKDTVREVYAERKVSEALSNPKFKDDPQGLKTELTNHYGQFPKLHAAMQAEVNKRFGIEEAPETRSPELHELTPNLQSLYSSNSGGPLQLDKEFPKVPKDPVINEQFNDIEVSSPLIQGRIDQKDDFKSEAHPKFSNIHLGNTGKAFAPGAPYHAAKIDLPGGSFVAAQGPLEKTETNFVKLLAHHRPPVSVSLVNSDELTDPKISGRRNTRRSIEIGPKEVGEEKDYGGIKVKLEGKYDFDGGRVTVKQLSINGETQFRVYDKGWEDHSAGNPERLAKLAVLVEKLRQHPSVSARTDNPTVVNCNAGVGRTGTFVTIDNSLREYQKTGQPPQDYTQTITTARKVRNSFVQTAGQFNTVSAVHNNFTRLFAPLLEEADLTVATHSESPITPEESIGPDDNGPEFSSAIYSTVNKDERDAERLRKASQDENYENTSFGQIRDSSIEEVLEEDDNLEPPPILTPSPAPDDVEVPDSPTLSKRTASLRPKDANQLLNKITEGGYGNSPASFDSQKLVTDLIPVLRQADQAQFTELLNYTETLKSTPGWQEVGLAAEQAINDHIQNRSPNAVDQLNRPGGQVRS
ncbi:tyrosine-protein phosphatase [Endozoicomonas arenosclerae]|uniref:tyrosine-protein phosphatase n=1 Tax=Endozoicomonas arenosclerae TaxID=1633495 RepID=UPI001560D4A5|nr:tyrosine-protein phosphatase [Endozoicomonas arenosclerae]